MGNKLWQKFNGKEVCNSKNTACSIMLLVFHLHLVMVTCADILKTFKCWTTTDFTQQQPSKSQQFSIFFKTNKLIDINHKATVEMLGEYNFGFYKAAAQSDH